MAAMIAAALSSLLLILFSSPASAAVDIGGPWFVGQEIDLGGAPGPDFRLSCHWDVTQSGSTLSADFSCSLGLGGPPSIGTLSGTIDPDAGSFTLSRSDPFCTGNGGTLTMHGLVAPDGLSFAGTVDCFGSPGQSTFTADLCQNGALDAGEACDLGIDQYNDCCSEGCEVLPATTPCGVDDGDGNVCTRFSCDGAAAVCPGTSTNAPAGTTCGPPAGCVAPTCDGAGSCSDTAIFPDGHRCAGQCVDGSGTCQAGVCSAPFKPAGAPCYADGNPCTVDTCDAAGVCLVGACSACCEEAGESCAPSYDASCQHPDEAKARVAIKRRRTGGSIDWVWAKGAQPSLGDPASDGAALCAYAGSTPLLIVAADAATGACGDAACWDTSGRAARYRDPQGSRGSVRSLVLRPGANARLSAKARGVAFAEGAEHGNPFSLATPVRVQLKVAGQCWESTFSTARTSDTDGFTAVAGSPSGAFLDGGQPGF